MNKIILDHNQKEIFESCCKIANSIGQVGFACKLKNFFCNSNYPAGIYMHGSVGAGKTMLMQMFYKQISVPKEIIHFQKFMRELHLKLHKLQESSADRILQDLALDIARRARVICVDEFEIKDITDAMIIMRLFRYLSQNNVFVFLTTNVRPEDLYLDGLQRESFLPFIAMIQRDFKVMHLAAKKDYRYDASSNIKERILYPVNQNALDKMEKIKASLLGKASVYSADIPIFGRQLAFKQTYRNILFTNFEELFNRDLSHNDYVAICEYFKIIVLEPVRPIAEDENNIIIRFINFIDNAYFYKILLFAQLDVLPDQLYIKGKSLKEFKRSISRLNEMNSDKYLNEN